MTRDERPRPRPADRAPPQGHRPHARPHRAPARRPRPSRAPPAAGDPRRRHQRQGLGRRHDPRRPRGAGAPRPRLHLAAPRALPRAHPPRRRADRRDRARRRPRALRGGERRRSRSPSSRSPPPPPSSPSPRPRPTTLLEVGLGGRLDATNVIERPRLSVITPVSIDHQQYLGETLRRDRRREGRHPQARRPAVVGGQEPDGLAVIEARAEAVGAPLDGRRPRLAGLGGARPPRLPRRDRPPRPAPARC